MLNKIFSLNNEDSANHITLIIFGIKLHILYPDEHARRKYYYKQYKLKNIADIPKAEGNLRSIQLANLSLLKQFDKLCKDNNINYWIDFGTLLGAKRHKGFIPWDDDIDVGMPRDDYEKFIELFYSKIEKYPDLYCTFSCNGRNKCFIKIRHKKSKILFIDIFPYDYAPKMTDKEKVIFSKKIAKLVKRNIFIYFKTPAETRTHLKKLTAQKLIHTNSKGSLFWGLDFPHKWTNKVYDYEQIFPLQEIEFEGALFPAPARPDEVLTSIYGDYMSIPDDTYPRHSKYNLNDEELTLINSLAGGE